MNAFIYSFKGANLALYRDGGRGVVGAELRAAFCFISCFPFLFAFDVGGLGFEFCVFVAGWRHALRSEWPFISTILQEQTSTITAMQLCKSRRVRVCEGHVQVTACACASHGMCMCKSRRVRVCEGHAQVTACACTSHGVCMRGMRKSRHRRVHEGHAQVTAPACACCARYGVYVCVRGKES